MTTNQPTYQMPQYGGVDPLAKVSETEPDVLALQEEYTYAWNQDPEVLSRIALAEDVRYTRWAGQSWDGLKHQDLLPEGHRAMPYDRAPDTRVNLADSIIQAQVDADYAAFWNARVQVAPTAPTRMSVAQAAEWRQLISWMIHGPLLTRLIDDVEFVSQVMHTIGWVVLHPTWRRIEQLRLQRVNMDQIAAIAARAPRGTALGAVDVIVRDPSMEEAATDLIMQFFPNLKKPRALRVIRELRDEGEAEFPAPQLVMNGPELNVLVPWQDFIMPIEATAQPYEARAMFRRMFLTTAQLEQRAREEDWNQEFVTAALKTKGSSIEEGTSAEHDADENMQLIEICYAYNKGVDEDDCPGLYCTVISPHVQSQTGTTPLYGQHWLLDSPHGQYPFIFLQTEVTGRRPADARGTPHILVTAQQEMKQQRDATYVYSQLSVTPPLQKKGTQASRLPPELGPLGVINTSAGSEWSWFNPPPGKPEIAFQLTELVRKESEDFFGVQRPDSTPGRWQLRQQRPVSRFLAKFGQAFWQLSVLAYDQLEQQELESIIGHAPLLTAETLTQHQLMLWYDVRASDPNWVESFLKNIAEMILPADTAGVVDRSKLIQFALSYLSPTLSEELTVDQAGASQALFKGVRDEIGSIMQGNEGLYVENDPTAKSKLMFADQIVKGNQDYMLQLDERSPQFNPRKRGNLDKWVKNLHQSAVQQDNKTIGRLGVKPGPEAATSNAGNGNGNGGY